MTVTVVAPGLGVPGQVCTAGHILGGLIFQGGVLSLRESCHQGGSHFYGGHISGAVTSLVTTGGHWGWGQCQVSSTWAGVSHSGLQNRQSWRRRVSHHPMGGDK